VLSATRILLSRAESDESLTLVARGGDEQHPADFDAAMRALGPGARIGGSCHGPIGDGSIVIVICDGISSASAGDVAAQTAATAAGRALADAITASSPDAGAATVDAIRTAHEAVERGPWTTRVDRAVPSCTFAGWIGPCPHARSCQRFGAVTK
jgi:hypothetical protein